jgi:hypothetical protein
VLKLRDPGLSTEEWVNLIVLAAVAWAVALLRGAMPGRGDR